LQFPRISSLALHLLFHSNYPQMTTHNCIFPFATSRLPLQKAVFPFDPKLISFFYLDPSFMIDGGLFSFHGRRTRLQALPLPGFFSFSNHAFFSTAFFSALGWRGPPFKSFLLISLPPPLPRESPQTFSASPRYFPCGLSFSSDPPFCACVYPARSFPAWIKTRRGYDFFSFAPSLFFLRFPSPPFRFLDSFFCSPVGATARCPGFPHRN